MQWEAGRRPGVYPGGPGAAAPGVRAAEWAGDPRSSSPGGGEEASIHLFSRRWQSREATL